MASLAYATALCAAERQVPYVIEADQLEWTKLGNVVHALGHVTVVRGDMHLRTTEVTVFADHHQIETTTPVQWRMGNNSGQASAASFNSQNQTGIFYNSEILIDDGTLLWGERIERLAPDEYVIDQGGFTPCACPQQGPYPSWKISVRHAKVHWRENVRFRGGTFWGRRMPFLYLPAGYVPLPENRQSGLLIPRLAYSRRYGFSVKPGLFVALGDQADITLWSDYTTLGGFGAEAEARAVSARGSYTLGYDWFKEASDAPFLAEEGRGPSIRWALTSQFYEEPAELFRLSGDFRLLSDSRLNSDFADDLQDLSLTTSLSQVHISREYNSIGAAIIRLAASQALLDSSTTGSRAPNLRLWSDALHLQGLPFWLGVRTGYDHFSSYNQARGNLWNPNAYDQQARRLSAGIAAGGQVDPVPGLNLAGNIGVYSLWRDRTFYTQVSTNPYRTSRSTLAITSVAVAHADASAEYGLRFFNRAGSAALRPGLDTRWSRPTDNGSFAIEDLDSPAWQTWLIPRLYVDGDLAAEALWHYQLRYPIAYAKSPRPLELWTHDLGLDVVWLSTNVRVWQNAAAHNIPRIDNYTRVTPIKGHTFGAGFSRASTTFTQTEWDLGRGGAWANDVMPLSGYRELLLTYDWKIWRLFGNITGRRRYPQFAGHPAAWVEQSISLGYHDPCECLRVAAGWTDLPGVIADRLDIRIDFAVLGGVGNSY